MVEEITAGADAPTAGLELFRVDIRRASLPELWRLSGPLGFPIAFFVFKVLRGQLPLTGGMTRPDRLEILEPDQVPTALRVLLDPLVAACEAEGFRRHLVYSVPMRQRDTEGVGVELLADDGIISATAIASESSAGGSMRRESAVSFSTRLAGGRYLSTTSNRLRFRVPPEVDAEHHPMASPARLLERQRHRLEALGPGAVEPIRPEEVRELILARERRWFDFQRERGVLVPLTMRERQQTLLAPETPSPWGFGSLDWKSVALWIACFVVLLLLFQSC